MKRSISTLVLSFVCCIALSQVISGCSTDTDKASDAQERKIFAGDASKMPADMRQKIQSAQQQAASKMASGKQ